MVKVRDGRRGGQRGRAADGSGCPVSRGNVDLWDTRTALGLSVLPLRAVHSRNVRSPSPANAASHPLQLRHPPECRLRRGSLLRTAAALNFTSFQSLLETRLGGGGRETSVDIASDR